jgi:hypothetical protein
MASQPGLTSTLPSVLKLVLRHLADARGDLVFGAREEHRHEAAHHQVVQLLLGLGQAVGACVVGMMAKWSLTLLLSKMRLLGARSCPPAPGAQRAPGGACRVGQHAKGLACATPR